DPKNPQLQYKWCNVGVLEYDEEKKLFLVHKSTDMRLMTAADCRAPHSGVPSPTSFQYWVPRIRLMFCAENPRWFAQRIVAADQLRKKTEALLLYNLYVDCMPASGSRNVTAESLHRMRERLLSTARLKKDDAYV
ncbi:hypothetical protein GDO81_030013, partial [Engystomops pustulosus]